MGRQIAHIDEGNGDCCGQLRQEYDSLLREKGECRRVLEDLMRENELKTKECHEAQTSLRKLQMELMRKSMHAGSLAADFLLWRNKISSGVLVGTNDHVVVV